jgi:hypothetical protein
MPVINARLFIVLLSVLRSGVCAKHFSTAKRQPCDDERIETVETGRDSTDKAAAGWVPRTDDRSH